ncbi:hypothetical protein LCGC14_1348450 [marine sediment metagenome]|uniref:Uncharacterized protein n=1 Tax=marine sediment metagenome TaxID=412755 RepID=A0A0F9KC77_9ZZZZ
MSRPRAPFAIRVALLWMAIVCAVILTEIPAPSFARTFFAFLSIFCAGMYVWEAGKHE